MEIVTKIAPIILALIMLGLGLGLKVEDFTRVLKTPKDFFVGFFSQLIILPIVAYLLIIILKTPPEIAIGVMIIAAAPGGVTSNILTKFANGDVALSITLTAVKVIDNATSPFANLVNMFDVTPPGAAAMIITPIAISGGVFKIIINR